MSLTRKPSFGPGWRVPALVLGCALVVGAAGYFGLNAKLLPFKTPNGAKQPNGAAGAPGAGKQDNSPPGYHDEDIKKSDAPADEALQKADEASAQVKAFRLKKNLTPSQTDAAQRRIGEMCNEALAKADTALHYYPRNFKALKARAFAYVIRDDPGDSAKAKQAVRDALALQADDAQLLKLQKALDKK